MTRSERLYEEEWASRKRRREGYGSLAVTHGRLGRKRKDTTRTGGKDGVRGH